MLSFYQCRNHKSSQTITDKPIRSCNASSFPFFCVHSGSKGSDHKDTNKQQQRTLCLPSGTKLSQWWRWITSTVHVNISLELPCTVDLAAASSWRVQCRGRVGGWVSLLQCAPHTGGSSSPPPLISAYLSVRLLSPRPSDDVAFTRAALNFFTHLFFLALDVWRSFFAGVLCHVAAPYLCAHLIAD